MQIVPWTPFRNLTRFDDPFTRLFTDNSDEDWLQLSAPDVDMYEQDGRLKIEASLPDYAEKDIKISTTGATLEIKAEHQDETENKGRKYLLRQRSSGSYWQKITLPEGTTADQAEASFEDGRLMISMPMAKPKQPKAIAIKARPKPAKKP